MSDTDPLGEILTTRWCDRHRPGDVGIEDKKAGRRAAVPPLAREVDGVELINDPLEAWSDTL